jgi:hypothetical protein
MVVAALATTIIQDPGPMLTCANLQRGALNALPQASAGVVKGPKVDGAP